MQFGGFEPRTVQARKLNDLVKMVEHLQVEVYRLKESARADLKQQEEKPVKKASVKKVEEKSEATE